MLGRCNLIILIIKILIIKNEGMCVARASFGQCPHSLGGVTHCPNTIFQGGVKSVSLWSFWRRHVCRNQISGWSTIYFFLLIPLFSFFSLPKNKFFLSFFFLASNLILILLIVIYFVFILFYWFFFFIFIHYHLIWYKFQIWSLLFWLLFVCFYHFSNWILFSISPLNILYQIIFESNLVILLILIFCLFWRIFLLYCFPILSRIILLIYNFALLFLRFVFYGVGLRLMTKVIGFEG